VFGVNPELITVDQEIPGAFCPIKPKVILVDAGHRFCADLTEKAGSTVLA
jgi:hypothetical protein